MRWRCAGPFDGGPVASVQGFAGEPGVYVITTPNGGAWRTIDGGDNWTPIERAAASTPTADPHRWIDPANPRRIARTTPNGIEVSLDGGAAWAASHNLPIAEVAHLPSHQPATLSIADSVRPGLQFAGTSTGVNVSFDGGGHWASLRQNMPAVAINDLEIRGNDLVAATQGRSTWILEDISPLRQLTAPTAPASDILFKPAPAALPRVSAAADAEAPRLYLDYYLATTATGNVVLDILDPTGRVVHHAQSAAVDADDHWLAVARPLSATAGHHRVVWNLRYTPPPSPHHRFARFASALFEDEPADPDGPLVLAGTYRLRLTVGRGFGPGEIGGPKGPPHVVTQLFTVRNDPKTTPAELRVQQQRFALALKAYDAMDVAHRAFLQLARLRAEVRPLLTSDDPDFVTAVTDLDTRLNVIDGSDWTGLIIPDAPDENPEIEEEEEFVKHPDFIPPKPVSLSKDYDDPTTILGRRFDSVTHAPAFAILGTTLGAMVTKTGSSVTAPDAHARNTYTHACQELAGVLKEWRRINAQDLPRLNAELAKRNLPRLSIASPVPAIACAPAK